MKPRSVSLALKLLAVLPALAIAVAIWHWGVNLPFWDEWDLSTIFLKQTDGHLSLAALADFHNESRPLFPRLAFLIIGKLTHWNFKAFMAVTFLLACAIAYLLHRLRSKSFPAASIRSAFLLLLTNLLLFSPVQSEIWFWGFLAALLVPAICLVSGFLILDSPNRPCLRLTACIVLALIATFSFANGLLCWVLLLPAIIAQPTSSRRWLRVAIWLGAFMVTALLFFHHPQGSLNEHPLSERIMQPIRDPGTTLRYFLVFLAGPFAPAINSDEVNCTLIGVALFVSFLLAVRYAWKSRKTPALLHTLLPWLMLGCYAILSAALAASGRASDFGASQALSPRYCAFAIWLPISLAHIAFLAAPHLKSEIKLRTSRAAVSSAVSFLVASILLLHCLAIVPSVGVFRGTNLNRRQARAILYFLNLVPPQDASMRVLYPKPERLKNLATDLNARGFFRPPLFQKGGALNQISVEGRGALESVQQLANRSCFISCWALCATREREADVVLFTCESTSIPPRIFALSDQRVERADLVSKFQNKACSFCGWQTSCRPGDLPGVGPLLIRAWSFDCDSQTMCRLDGEFTLVRE
jgi:hypothetical protein